MPDCTAMDSSTCDAARQLLATAFVTTRVGEPDAGNLHVRFDEGERRHPSLPTRPSSCRRYARVTLLALADCEVSAM